MRTNPGRARAPETRERDDLAINAVRVLAMAAVQRAESGHPGTPMGLASLAHVLWTRHMHYNPVDPSWPNRDRFVCRRDAGDVIALHGFGSSAPYQRLFSEFGLTAQMVAERVRALMAREVPGCSG